MLEGTSKKEIGDEKQPATNPNGRLAENQAMVLEALRS